MDRITVYLVSGQTLSFEGVYEPIMNPVNGELIKHKFGTDEQEGLKINFLRMDMIAAVVTQKDWV